MRRPVLLALLALAAMAGASRPARAALTLCNRTSYILYAATAAVRGPQTSAQGWTRIAPGDCQVARKETLNAGAYLVYARSSLAHSGAARAWGGRNSVCVRDGNFTLAQPSLMSNCAAGGFALPFAPLNNRGQGTWTMNFDEQPVMSLDAAQLAGAKRLLADNGYKVGAVYGGPDKQTGAALADFRKRMRFPPQAGNAELFTALEHEAGRKTAPAGLTICNDAKDTLLLALGQGEGTKAQSRGWWTVQAGACARAIATALTDDPVYLLAQRGDGVTLAGGPRKFCVTAAAFEIRGAGGCTARGYGEAGFARLATQGRSGAAVHVGPDGKFAVQAGMLK